MGLFSSICSFVCGAIGGVVSGLCSAICGGISSVISSISNVISTVLSLLDPEKLKELLKDVLDFLDILDPEQDPEDLGDHALQAAECGMTPEDYATYQEYIAAIKDFKVDKEKSEQYSDKEKLAAGLTVATLCMADKFQVKPEAVAEMWTLAAAKPEFFTPERVGHYLDQNMDLKTVKAYFEGDKSLGLNDRVDTREALMSAEKSFQPNVLRTEEEIKADFSQMSEALKGLADKMP